MAGGWLSVPAAPAVATAGAASTVGDGSCVPFVAAPANSGEDGDHFLDARAAGWALHLGVAAAKWAQLVKLGPALGAPVFVDRHDGFLSFLGGLGILYRLWCCVGAGLVPARCTNPGVGGTRTGQAQDLPLQT